MRFGNFVLSMSESLQPVSESHVEGQLAAEERIRAWNEDRGDKTHRLHYDLGPSSVVFDLGGYEGQWASDIYSMYGCQIHVFEPVVEFASGIERRFSRNRRITIHRFGLAHETKRVPIWLRGDSSSIYVEDEESEEIQLIRADDFLREHGINHIDLMKINIEGAEYDLLDHLVESGFTRSIRNIQVQFHDFVDDAKERMAGIHSQLKVTHFATYIYPFVWENWERREANRSHEEE